MHPDLVCSTDGESERCELSTERFLALRLAFELLSDEATDMAAKLGEIGQIHRDMAELQTLAHRCHTEKPEAVDVTDGGGGGALAPLSIAPTATHLEAALDGLDIDGLLERLEKDPDAMKK